MKDIVLEIIRCRSNQLHTYQAKSLSLTQKKSNPVTLQRFFFSKMLKLTIENEVSFLRKCGNMESTRQLL